MGRTTVVLKLRKHEVASVLDALIMGLADMEDDPDPWAHDTVQSVRRRLVQSSHEAWGCVPRPEEEE